MNVTQSTQQIHDDQFLTVIHIMKRFNRFVRKQSAEVRAAMPLSGDIELALISATVHSHVDVDVLLESDISDFLHDILGVYENLDSHTGELDNCFAPRSAPDADALPAVMPWGNRGGVTI